MTQRSTSNVYSNGGLLTYQFLQRLSEDKPKEDGINPETYRLSNEEETITKSELESEIALRWQSLKERFDRYQDELPEMSISRARRLWIEPLLEELGYKPVYQRENIHIENTDLEFNLSHRGWNHDKGPIIHTVAPNQNLEEKETNKRGSHSPHDNVQSFLNLSDETWGIVTNGLQLRLLREFYHTYTKGYVAFDLENIFIERNFTDFRTLYRLAHASRFIPKDETTILESFYQKSVAAGVKIGDDLRENVKKAIEVLGNGFLVESLKEELMDDTKKTNEFYNEILHIIYRLLFLLYAEQRGMLPMRDSLYSESYSIMQLRDKSERPEYYNEHVDLWNGLQITFELLRKGSDQLNVYGYNGSLFDTTQLQMLSTQRCANTNLLEAIKNLTTYESEGVSQRISYLDIGVEEIGSIYESLLDYEPRISSEDIFIDENEYPSETFFLDPRGAQRRSTGSYYTPTELVNQIIDNSLKPVVECKLEDNITKEDKEKALLSIKVCDPATGSAAFLIAANNFLAERLARIREESENTTTESLRFARRDVLQHCIYGVDLNPMAVELAKVSLWINAAVKDKPLNFLDHHIKCGNSLIGASRELIEKGIPLEAYSLSKLSEEEKEIAKTIREKIKKEKRGIKEGFLLSYDRDIKKYIDDYNKLDFFTEKQASDVEEKKKFYQNILSSPSWKREKILADTWTASFFWPLKNGKNDAPTDNLIKLIKSGLFKDNDSSILAEIESIEKNMKFFHWYLEFPDVFSGKNPGFDCILGNPPFLGGLKISGIYGDDFRNYIKFRYKPFRGTTDLCAVFFKKAYRLIKKNSLLGMIATNTIGQGDTRESGLAQIIQSGGVIKFTRRFVKWIGAANVEVNLISIFKGNYNGNIELDGNNVSYISSRLDNLPEIEPKFLEENDNKAFVGDLIRGIGFVLNPEEAENLMKKDPKNKNCLLPYLSGDDLNHDPKQFPSRYVICFRDWNYEPASNYPLLLNIVEERVKPDRDKVPEKHDREKWWLFARYRNELRKAIENLNCIMVRSRVSENHMLTFVDKNICCSDATVIFAYDDFYHFAILQSSIHEIWLRTNASTMRTDIRYTPEDCFDTFPFPKVDDNLFDNVKKLGKEYYEIRKNIMINRNIGLTKTYNLFHDKGCLSDDIISLRNAHVKLDDVILKCYGWDDIETNHNFYLTDRDKIRFKINNEAKNEILRRLFTLNKKIFEIGGKT